MQQVVASHRERFGRLDVLVNNAGVGIGAPVAEMTTKKRLDLQLDLNLRSLDPLLPRVRRPAARRGRRAPQRARGQHGVDLGQVAAQAWLSVYSRDEGGGRRLHAGDAPRARRRGHQVHGAVPGLRRHADDRLRQGPGQRRGHDPARGHRRGVRSCCSKSSPGVRRPGDPVPAARRTRSRRSSSRLALALVGGRRARTRRGAGRAAATPASARCSAAAAARRARRSRPPRRSWSPTPRRGRAPSAAMLASRCASSIAQLALVARRARLAPAKRSHARGEGDEARAAAAAVGGEHRADAARARSA